MCAGNQNRTKISVAEVVARTAFVISSTIKSQRDQTPVCFIAYIPQDNGARTLVHPSNRELFVRFFSFSGSLITLWPTSSVRKMHPGFHFC
jgi:hypothetical protein